jgi:hypothetical protein
MTMTATTTGWLSVGFSTSSSMSGADAVVAWIDTSGNVAIYDSWMPDKNQPRLDTDLGGTSDVTSVSGSATSSSTTITFTRLVNTNDKYDQVIVDGSMYVLWAYAPIKGTSRRRAVTYEQHTQYGSGQVNFFSGSSSSNPVIIIPGANSAGGMLGNTLLDPGELLMIFVLTIFSVAAIIRHIRKCIKRQTQYRRRAELQMTLSQRSFNPILRPSSTTGDITDVELGSAFARRASRPVPSPQPSRRITRVMSDEDQHAAFQSAGPVTSIMGPRAEPWSAPERNYAARRQTMRPVSMAIDVNEVSLY